MDRAHRDLSNVLDLLGGTRCKMNPPMKYYIYVFNGSVLEIVAFVKYIQS